MSAPRWPVRPAAVALDLLADEERAVAERLLVDDPNFRAAVERLRATARGLSGLEAEVWQPVPPPPLQVERGARVAPPKLVASSAAAAAQSDVPQRVAPRGRPWPPRVGRRPAGAARRRPALFVAAAAAVLAALAVTGVLLARGGADGGRPSTTLALRALPGVRGQARLTIAGAEAELRGSGLRPSGAHDYYEAWLADAAGRMVSMGTFRVGRDGRVDAHMPVAVDVTRYRLVDVSLEPDDGDPAHSDRSVLRARLELSRAARG